MPKSFLIRANFSRRNIADSAALHPGHELNGAQSAPYKDLRAHCASENTGADHNVLLYSRNTNASIALTPQRDLRAVDEQQSADHVPISRVARSAYRGIRSFTVSATLRALRASAVSSLLAVSLEQPNEKCAQAAKTLKYSNKL
jgi:hypothetical protein